METQSLVSIIIPVYNGEDYIHMCIDSVLDQVYTEFEIIIINDGSQDRTGIICDRYASKDKRIKVIHQDNAGPSVARNNGIIQSSGEHLQFVDADDQIENKMVQKLLNIKEGSDLVVCGNKSIIKQNGDYLIKENKPEIEGNFPFNKFMQNFPELFRKNLINSPCNKLYDANIVKRNNIYFQENVNNGEDLLFNIQYMKFCKRITLLNDSPYFYHNFNNKFSLTKNYKKRFLENRKMIFNELNDFIRMYKNVAADNNNLLREVFTNYVIQVFENNYNSNVKTSWRSRKRKLKYIINSEWVYDNFDKFKVMTSQEKLILFLLERQNVFALHMYFCAKVFLKRNFKKMFKLFRKINSMVS